MGGFIHYNNGQLWVESCAVADIAKKYGTPFYCYSAGQIAQNYMLYKNAFAGYNFNTHIHYAVKANSNIAILNILAKLGAGADVVSVGEIQRCERAGIAPEKIIFSGVGKTAMELEYALKIGVGQINAESFSECQLISQIAQKMGKTAKLALRINPDVASKTHKHISTGKKGDKFGIDYDQAVPAFQYANGLPNIICNGLAMHIGSQITDISEFDMAYQKATSLIEQLRKAGITINVMDCGGGLGINYQGETPPNHNEYAHCINRIFGNSAVAIGLEPGRSIIANAGILVCQIIRQKQSGKTHITIIDAAMNDLIRPLLYDGHHKIMPINQHSDSPTLPQNFVGPICETGDYLALNRTAPQMHDGELLAFGNVGAYGAVMASMYNARPLIREILVDGAMAHEIRRAISVDEQMGWENIPV